MDTQIFSFRLRRFITLFFLFHIYSISYSTQLSDSLLQIAQKSTDINKVCLANIDLAWEYMYKNSDTAAYFAIQAIEISEENKISELVIDAHISLGVVEITKANYNLAINQFEKAEGYCIEYLKINPDADSLISAKLFSVHNNMGNCYYFLGNYSLALKKYEQTLSILNTIKVYKYIPSCLSNIASTYIELNKLDMALSYYQKAYQKGVELNDTSEIAKIYTNIGLYYIHQFNYDSAKYYTNKAKKLYQVQNNTYLLIPTYINLGKIFIQSKKFDSANIYLSKAFILSNKIDYPDGIINYYFIRGEYFEKQDLIDSAIQVFEYAYRQSLTQLNTNMQLQSASKLEQIYTHINDYKMAYHYLTQSKLLQDSIFNIESDKRIAEMQVKYRLSVKEANINLLKGQKARQKQLALLLASIILITLILSSLIIRSEILKRKKQKALHNLEKKLIETQLETSMIQKERLSEKLEFKTKQLTTHALHMMQKNKVLSGMNNQLDDLIKGDSVDNSSLRKIKRQINQSLKSEKDWDLFKLYFEQINSGFFNYLVKHYPELNTYDLRHCALIKLSLSTKESASVLNLSPYSVKSARYRLKKKLSLNKEESLSDFIRKI